MLSKKSIEHVIRKIFPGCTVVKFSRFHAGFLNETYDVVIKNPKKNLVLRTFMKDDWKASKEKYVYDLIREKTNAPVPQVYLIDRSKKVLPFTFNVMEKVPGIEINKFYDKTGNARLFYDAGALLGKLHSIKFPYFGWIVGNGINPMFKHWRNFVEYDFSHKLNQIKKIKKVPKIIITKAVDYFNSHKDLLDIKEGPVLIHKDYHSSHIFVNNNKISGIIDVEWAMAGHSELDLIKSLWWMFDDYPKMKKPFLQGYKSQHYLGKGFERRKVLYELVLLVGLIAFSHDVHNKKWFSYNIKKVKEILGVR